MRLDLGRRWSSSRIGIEDRLNQGLRILVKTGWIFEFPLEDLLEGEVVGRCSEWGFAGEELKDNTPECPYVGTGNQRGTDDEAGDSRKDSRLISQNFRRDEISRSDK